MVTLRDSRNAVDRRPHWGLLSVLLLAVVLVLLLASPASAFPDVPTAHPYADAITGLADEGIIGGYSNGKFGLLDPVKRAQFAKMITGTLGIPPNSSTWTRFIDLGAPDAYGYPHAFVQAAFDYGITYGANPAQDQFNPWGPIHRDQAVSMIVRGVNTLFPSALLDPPVGTYSSFAGIPDPHGGNLRLAEYNGLLEALVGLGPSWNVTANATRGEVAQMLWNLFGHLVPAGVWVYADGSGDYPTIEAAVADIATGATIYLGPGTFRLSQTLAVDFSFNLVGSGMAGPNATVVTCNDTVLDVASVSFSAQDIKFVSTANNKPTDVMAAGDATIHILRCAFSGAFRWNDHAGDGLYLYGTTSATVQDSVFTQNDLNGVELDEDAQVTLEDNECSGNGSNGIGFWANSVGVARGNTCTANAYSGILSERKRRGPRWRTTSARRTRTTASDSVTTPRGPSATTTAPRTSPTMASLCMTMRTLSSRTTRAGAMPKQVSISRTPAAASLAATSVPATNGALYVNDAATPTIGSNNLHGNAVSPQLYDERVLSSRHSRVSTSADTQVLVRLQRQAPVGVGHDQGDGALAPLPSGRRGDGASVAAGRRHRGAPPLRLDGDDGPGVGRGQPLRGGRVEPVVDHQFQLVHEALPARRR